jgi:hypothetical protein
MKELSFEQLREIRWQRPLSPSEEARLREILAAEPGRAAEWKTDSALATLLGQQPRPVPSSNFTHLVMDSVRRAETNTSRAVPRRWLLRFGWIPRLAFVAVMAGIALFSLHEHEVSRRVEIARGVVEVSKEVGSVPKIEWLQNFDEIRGLGSAPAVDPDLENIFTDLAVQ